MCGPLLLAAVPAAIASAGAIAGFIGQGQASASNTTAANLSYAANQNVLGQRSVQIDQEQSQNTLNAAIARASAEGKVSASASSFGGDASTTTRQVNAADFSVGKQIGVEDINSQNQRLQVANDQTSDFYARQSQINKVPPPSPLSLGLSIAGDAAEGAANYSKLGGKF